MGVSTNRINVQRKTVLVDYLNPRKKRPWFKPEDHIKVVFIGEPAIGDGRPKREFFTGTVQCMHICVCLLVLKSLKTWFHFWFVKITSVTFFMLIYKPQTNSSDFSLLYRCT